MGYKLICLDMDGTVLNSEKKISKENKDAIKKAHDKGIKIAISTGRIFTSAMYYAEILGVKAPIIASNGAYIREKDKDKVIYQCEIEKEVCKKVASIAEKYNFFNCFNTYDKIIADKPFHDDYIYYKLNSELPENKRIKLESVSNFKNILNEDENKILKFISLSDDYEGLKKAKEEIKNIEELEVVSSGKNNIEVMKKGVSKGNAVKVLSQFYKIDKEDIICIGDSENDLSMIEYAGMGIVMGNGDDYMKEKANYITDTNDNNGVAKAIYKFVL